MDLQTISVLIAAAVFLASLVAQLVFFAYAWGKVNQTVENIEEAAAKESARVSITLSTVSQTMERINDKVEDHGTRITKVEEWRRLITPHMNNGIAGNG